MEQEDCGRLEIVTGLIRAAVPIVVETPSNTLLHLADVNNDVDIINMLLLRVRDIPYTPHIRNQYDLERDVYGFANGNNKRTITELLNPTFRDGKKNIDYGIWNMEVVGYFLRRHGGVCSSLWLSIARGDLKTLKLLLGSEASKGSNREVLHAAVFCRGIQYREIVEILLQNGFTVKPEDAGNLPFFFTAIEKNYLKIVVPLLKYGVDVEMRISSDLLSPLHVAVKYKLEQIVKLLISCGADVNARTKSGKTPIFYAVENADLKMTRLLLNNRGFAKDTCKRLNIARSDVDINASDTDGRTPLHCIAVKYPFDVGDFPLIGPHEYNVYKEIVKLLLSRGANIDAVNKSGSTAFELAIRGDYIKSVEAILEYVDVNSTFKDGMTALHCSASIGHEVISKMLLQKGANANAKLKQNNWTPLHFAVQKRYKKVIEILLRCGARVDPKIISDVELSHLHVFAAPLKRGYLQTFRVLVENGADINSTGDVNGETVLYHIVRCEEPKNLTAVLTLGANVNIENWSQHTLLYYARRENIIVLHYHLAKLKAANLYLSKKNLLSLRFIGRTKQMRKFQDECNEELSRMKSAKIANTSVSFYDILSADVSRLALYATNKSIVQALKPDDYKRIFPIYANVIESNFNKGKRRERVLEGTDPFFESISNNLPKLPYLCNEKILSYLNAEDIRILKLSVKTEVGREELLEQGYRHFHFLFINVPDFSYELTEKIFSHLSNDDLRNLAAACKSAKVCDSTFPPLRSPS